jgi:hypothetical protein
MCQKHVLSGAVARQRHRPGVGPWRTRRGAHPSSALHRAGRIRESKRLDALALVRRLATLPSTRLSSYRSTTQYRSPFILKLQHEVVRPVRLAGRRPSTGGARGPRSHTARADIPFVAQAGATHGDRPRPRPRAGADRDPTRYGARLRARRLRAGTGRPNPTLGPGTGQIEQLARTLWSG